MNVISLNSPSVESCGLCAYVFFVICSLLRFLHTHFLVHFSAIFSSGRKNIGCFSGMEDWERAVNGVSVGQHSFGFSFCWSRSWFGLLLLQWLFCSASNVDLGLSQYIDRAGRDDRVGLRRLFDTRFTYGLTVKRKNDDYNVGNSCHYSMSGAVH
ncbi:hypothetical protein BO78DRAFT_14179 [Aspergillus sclerotiicarbonarius CBS 121057]|uniref:Uncharacterized protein n=1 Tax=Aspergillus sclerotiicarbonarius (strain CBS 121057 / IBT 28362) TaxID=1448318 RepID=A0A319F3H9_ASPSB|nr:hypothetical protein BO78DRAFT_14179 [Aspergillus sclerotiicarbonarius CBS 121057]